MVALLAMLAWSSVSNAVAPPKTHTNVSREEGRFETFSETSGGELFIQVSAAIIKSTETKGPAFFQIFYFYINQEIAAQGTGFCTVPATSLVGHISTRKGELSLNVDTKDLIEVRDCQVKSGGNLKIMLQWMSNGLSLSYVDESRTETTRFFGGMRITAASRGKSYTLSANARAIIVGDDVGTVAGTIGVGGTLDGFAELVKAKDISRSFEVTPGAS